MRKYLAAAELYGCESKLLSGWLADEQTRSKQHFPLCEVVP